MSSPATHADLDRLEQRTDRKFEAIMNRLDQVVIELKRMRLDMGEMEKGLRFEMGEMEKRLRLDMGEMAMRLSVDLARHANAIQENVAMQIRVVDEKYADLPARVSALESATAAAPVHKSSRRKQPSARKRSR